MVADQTDRFGPRLLIILVRHVPSFSRLDGGTKPEVVQKSFTAAWLGYLLNGNWGLLRPGALDVQAGT